MEKYEVREVCEQLNFILLAAMSLRTHLKLTLAPPPPPPPPLLLCTQSVMQATLVLLVLGGEVWLLCSASTAETAVIVESLFAERTSAVGTWVEHPRIHTMPLPDVVN